MTQERLKYGKAPGPDNMPNEIVREVVGAWPELLLETYNVCLHKGVFHKRWKRQKLVLLRKGDKPRDEPSSYRRSVSLTTSGNGSKDYFSRGSGSTSKEWDVCKTGKLGNQGFLCAGYARR